MRRFVDEIVLRNGPLAFDIIHALENNKNTKYEVDMCDREVFSENTGRRSSNGELIQLKIYIKEDMTGQNNAVQLSMDLK